MVRVSKNGYQCHDDSGSPKTEWQARVDVKGLFLWGPVEFWLGHTNRRNPTTYKCTIILELVHEMSEKKNLGRRILVIGEEIWIGGASETLDRLRKDLLARSKI